MTEARVKEIVGEAMTGLYKRIDGLTKRVDALAMRVDTPSGRTGADSMIDERNTVIDLVRHSGLGAIAKECHRMAVARGKYPEGWSLSDGLAHVVQELSEWAAEVIFGNPEGAKREFGDVLHVILSLGHHMRYDPEAELQDAMRRNAERARIGI